ncbi:MAG: peptide chain release factor N(5)-glutamine methyltransferase [Candidatus Peribacteraceae bacterium]|jgi:release factor glutamine methyltransferase
MRIQDLLRETVLHRSDAEILLAALFQKNRTWIMAHPEREVTEAERETWAAWEQRRLKREPIVYIIGEKEFYARPFIVDRRVLVPRPATEGLVDVALAFLHAPTDAVVPTDAGIVAVSRVFRAGEVTTVVDVGTGSGAIAVTLALERPDLSVIATDISENALAVARKNADRHGVAGRISFRQGSLLDPVRDLTRPFLLVSNPPYVRSDRTLPRDITDFEPHAAVFAGPDGMEVIRPLLKAAKAHPACSGFVLECEAEQAQTL